MSKPTKTEMLTRNFEARAENFNEADRTITLSFSSDAPVERWGEREILSHAPGAMDVTRLLQAGAVLFNHDRDLHLGKPLSVRIREDGKSEAVIKFGRSPLAEEKLQDVRDGILTSVSVSYTVEEWLIDKEANTRTALKWTPYEISLVTIPADISVGVGRSMTFFEEPQITNQEQERKMSEPTNAAASGADVMQVRQSETARIREITAIGDAIGQRDAANRAIERGVTVEDFRAIGEALSRSRPVQAGEMTLGASERDLSRYSLRNALLGLMEQRDISNTLEGELSIETAKRMKKEGTGKFFIPLEVLERGFSVTGDGGAYGGNTVQTNVTGWIGNLRPKMMTSRMGVSMLTGLVGNVSMPKQNGSVSMQWLSETEAVNESKFAIGNIAMTPKRLSGLTVLSKQLLLQPTEDVEGRVRSDMLTGMALSLDAAIINGLGAGSEPKGILHADNHTPVYAGSTPGAKAVSGTHATGAALTWSDIVNLIGAVSAADADIGSLGYMTNSLVMAQLMQTEKAPGTAQFIWPDSRSADGLGTLAGQRAAVTNQVPRTLTKGGVSTLSALIYGDWSSVNVGLWGGVELSVDPYTLMTSGQIKIVINQYADVACSRQTSFAAIKDAVA